MLRQTVRRTQIAGFALVVVSLIALYTLRVSPLESTPFNDRYSSQSPSIASLLWPGHFETHPDDHRENVVFVAKGRCYIANTQSDGLSLIEPSGSDGIRIRFHGAKRHIPATLECSSADIISVVRSHRGKTSVSPIKRYERITFPGVLPGIDVIYKCNNGVLEFDFEIAPGADPEQIFFPADEGTQFYQDQDNILSLKITEAISCIMVNAAIPPSDKQVKYAVAIARRFSKQLTAEVLQSREAMTAFIGTHAKRYRQLNGRL